MPQLEIKKMLRRKYTPCILVPRLLLRFYLAAVVKNTVFFFCFVFTLITSTKIKQNSSFNKIS